MGTVRRSDSRRRLHRDPLVISRLYSACSAARDIENREVSTSATVVIMQYASLGLYRNDSALQAARRASATAGALAWRRFKVQSSRRLTGDSCGMEGDQPRKKPQFIAALAVIILGWTNARARCCAGKFLRRQDDHLAGNQGRRKNGRSPHPGGADVSQKAYPRKIQTS